MIKSLETTVPSCSEEKERIAREIEEMKGKKLSLLRNPNSDSSQKYKPSKSTKKNKDKILSTQSSATDLLLAFSDSSGKETVPTTFVSQPDPVNNNVPSNLEITSTVSEIMTNLRAKREPKIESPLRPSNGYTEINLPQTFSSSNSITSIITPNNLNSIESISSYYNSLPSGTPMTTTSTTDNSSSNGWSSNLTIAPLLNPVNDNNSSRILLPIMEPPVNNDRSVTWNWKL